MQNFRAKPDTAMRHRDDLPTRRVPRRRSPSPASLLGPRMRVQAPPNLADADEVGAAAARRRRRLGRRLAADPRPREPRAAVAAPRRAGRGSPPTAGFALRERLTAHPEYVLRRRRRGSTRGCARTSPRWPTADGLGVEGRLPVGLPVAGARRRLRGRRRRGRTDLHTRRSTPRAAADDRRSDFDEVYGDWAAIGEHVPTSPHARRCPSGSTPTSATALRARPSRPGGAGQPDERAPRAGADDARRSGARRAGPHRRRRAPRRRRRRRHLRRQPQHQLHQRLLHRLPVLRVRAARAPTPTRSRSRSTRWPTARRRRGTSAPPRSACRAASTPTCRARLLRPGPRGEARASRTCTCTRSRRWRSSTARPAAAMSRARVAAEAKEAGLDSIPGTAAEILDDDVRWVLTKGKLPTAAWIEVVTTAHEVGLRSSSTMMYGHVDTPRHWVGAPARCCAGSRTRPAGSPSSSPLPFVHQNAPLYLAGVARPGPDRARQPRRARDGPGAAARRGSTNIQSSLGEARRRAARRAMLRGGCQRPRRHADGGDHLAGWPARSTGRRRRVADLRGHRRGRRAARPAAHHDLRRGRGGASCGRPTARADARTCHSQPCLDHSASRPCGDQIGAGVDSDPLTPM